MLGKAEVAYRSQIMHALNPCQGFRLYYLDSGRTFKCFG